MSMEELSNVQGRAWDDIDVSGSLADITVLTTNIQCSIELDSLSEKNADVEKLRLHSNQVETCIQ
jgi:hypothetical protein